MTPTNPEIREKLEGWHVVAELNEGYSHIAVDDSCYVLLNNGSKAHWWFQEAVEALRDLPVDPSECLRQTHPELFV